MHLNVSLSFFLNEVHDRLSGSDHQTGLLLQKLEEQSVHVAVGMQCPKGISTFFSFGKAVCVCVCVCVSNWNCRTNITTILGNVE